MIEKTENLTENTFRGGKKHLDRRTERHLHHFGGGRPSV